jgi:hypothetical protein
LLAHRFPLNTTRSSSSARWCTRHAREQCAWIYMQPPPFAHTNTHPTYDDVQRGRARHLPSPPSIPNPSSHPPTPPAPVPPFFSSTLFVARSNNGPPPRMRRACNPTHTHHPFLHTHYIHTQERAAVCPLVPAPTPPPRPFAPPPPSSRSQVAFLAPRVAHRTRARARGGTVAGFFMCFAAPHTHPAPHTPHRPSPKLEGTCCRGGHHHSSLFGQRQGCWCVWRGRKT